jgi:hypothetical protein
LAQCTLDDRASLELALREPDQLVSSFGPHGAFIDEAQRAPGILLAIKAAVDRQSGAGQFLLCGSNQPSMSDAVGDTLLGRAAYRTLRPLTLSEMRLEEQHRGWSFLFNDDDAAILDELRVRQARSGVLDWQEAVTTGGFPRAVAARPADRLRLLDEYARVFSTRDIRELIGVDSTDRFETFLRLVAMRIGHPLNHSSFAVDLGVSVSTVRRWVDALRRSFLLETISPYSTNPAQRVIKAPKFFFVDAALALAAAREQEPNGFHLENLVCSDLLVWRDGSRTRSVFHWRLQAGQEVDFIIEEDGRLVAIEVKTSSAAHVEDTRHLRVFRERYPTAVRGLLLSSDPEVRRLGRGVIAAPWWSVL